MPSPPFSLLSHSFTVFFQELQALAQEKMISTLRPSPSPSPFHGSQPEGKVALTYIPMGRTP